jgi:hypothetical protein
MAARAPFTILAGLVIGVAMTIVMRPGVDAMLSIYDAANPVIVARGDVITATPDEITIALTATKVRMCQYMRLQAYGRRADGVLDDPNIARIDQTEDRDTKPLGTFSLGVWRIWPRGKATSVVIYSEHSCSGRLVRTKLIDIPVPLRHGESQVMRQF